MLFISLHTLHTSLPHQTQQQQRVRASSHALQSASLLSSQAPTQHSAFDFLEHSPLTQHTLTAHTRADTHTANAVDSCASRLRTPVLLLQEVSVRSLSLLMFMLLKVAVPEDKQQHLVPPAACCTQVGCW